MPGSAGASSGDHPPPCRALLRRQREMFLLLPGSSIPARLDPALVPSTACTAPCLVTARGALLGPIWLRSSRSGWHHLPLANCLVFFPPLGQPLLFRALTRVSKDPTRLQPTSKDFSPMQLEMRSSSHRQQMEGMQPWSGPSPHCSCRHLKAFPTTPVGSGECEGTPLLSMHPPLP